MALGVVSINVLPEGVPNAPAPIAAPPAGLAGAVQWPSQTFTGRGDDIVDLPVPRGLSIVSFTCADCVAASTVTIDDAGGGSVLEASGADGAKGWIAGRAGDLRRVRVDASAAWTMTVGDARVATSTAAAEVITGTGDDVILLPVSPLGMRLTVAAAGPVAIASTPDPAAPPSVLAVGLGPYNGRVSFPGRARPLLVHVHATGQWTLTPEP